jgi:hypothetical protein
MDLTVILLDKNGDEISRHVFRGFGTLAPDAGSRYDTQTNTLTLLQAIDETTGGPPQPPPPPYGID